MTDKLELQLDVLDALEDLIFEVAKANFQTDIPINLDKYFEMLDQGREILNG